jgi:hypothetical protein
MQQQHTQQSPLPGLRDIQVSTIVTDNLKLAKNTEPHQSPQPNSRLVRHSRDKSAQPLSQWRVPAAMRRSNKAHLPVDRQLTRG